MLRKQMLTSPKLTGLRPTSRKSAYGQHMGGVNGKSFCSVELDLRCHSGWKNRRAAGGLQMQVTCPEGKQPVKGAGKGQVRADGGIIYFLSGLWPPCLHPSLKRTLHPSSPLPAM
jgi:hypothetical protein